MTWQSLSDSMRNEKWFVITATRYYMAHHLCFLLFFVEVLSTTKYEAIFAVDEPATMSTWAGEEVREQQHPEAIGGEIAVFSLGICSFRVLCSL